MSCGCQVGYIGPSLANSCYGGSFILFMSILDTLIRDTCDVSELCQRVRPIVEPDDEYDFVVIGGGSAGSAVAGRLSEEKNWKVLVVEAGADEPPGTQVPAFVASFDRTSIDWNYKTESQEYACLGSPEQRCTWPRGKVLGGTGVIHGMMYMRGPAKDYNTWKALGNSEWGFDDVFKYFKKSEDNQQVGTLVNGSIHGTGGPMTTSRFPDHPVFADAILEAAKELGYPVSNDINEYPYSGFALAQANVRNGVRLSSARAFLRPARDRPNLHVMLNSTVSRIILDENKTISKVELIYQGQTTQTFTVKVRKEAIISAGSINSPQILLLSGIGPKDVLDKVNITQVHNLPGVGENLHNHVAFFVNYKLNDVKALNDLNWKIIFDYLATQTGPMSSSGMAQLTARLTSKYGDPEGDHPDLQLFFNGFAPYCSRTGEINESENGNNVNASKVINISPVVLHPKSRGFIGLKSSNPLDPPIMQPNYLKEIDDVKTLIDGIRIVRRLGETKVLKEKYGIEFIKENYGDCEEKFTFDSDEYWECAARYSTGPENHQAGTCKMGPSSDPLAVVDSKLQIYGIEGVRVMDASIMPFMVSGNPHASIVMIAEKGADYIKQKWNSN